MTIPARGLATAPDPADESVSTLVASRQVRADFQFLVIDGVLTLRPAVQVVMWGARGRGAERLPFWREVSAVHRDLVAIAHRALPPLDPAVQVDVLPAEPAMIEHEGRDETRLRIWAVSNDLPRLRSWAQALWTSLRGIGVRVEPSSWPRA